MYSWETRYLRSRLSVQHIVSVHTSRVVGLTGILEALQNWMDTA